MCLTRLSTIEQIMEETDAAWHIIDARAVPGGWTCKDVIVYKALSERRYCCNIGHFRKPGKITWHDLHHNCYRR
ncbi:hypothetical protein KEM48_006129 [Puccinia striiformis f. sp. tritici PST-130]|nr:hypothetical protein KEM48_006129 [Puccinia striiformis f. sp. tritici PST-130]